MNRTAVTPSLRNLSLPKLSLLKLALLKLALLATLSLALGAPATCQRDAGQKQDPGQQKVEKLSEWPDLKKAENDRVRAIAKQFRKKQEKLREAAVKKLVKIGAGAAPVLIPLVNDKADNANESVFAVLEQVTDRRHTALLARETQRKSVEWRRWLMRRLAGMHDGDLKPVLKATLKDKDQDIAFYAALGMLALGEPDGLDTVIGVAKRRWAEHKDLLAATLAPARSAKTAMKVWERIGQARPTDQMAGLRLLRHLMVKEQKMLLRSYLESPDFAVKREAINTARVLHGEKPLEKLSSFQAINLAKQWLDKL